MARTPKRPARPLLSCLLALLLLSATASEARASPLIEGVWSFNGGRIAIQSRQPGEFIGTVVAPTKFSLCTHPVGEEIWTQIVEQPDGSYWGLHQWFYDSSECVRNPALGQTAWRILQSAQGRYLRACFSEPGSGLQPTISSNGSVAGATFGCVDSALISSVPDLSSVPASHYVALPAGKTCLRRRTLRIHIRDPKNDPIEKIVVTVSGGGVTRRARVRQTAVGAVAIVQLGGFPVDSVVVRVTIRTVLGQHLAAKRAYRSCPASKRHRRSTATVLHLDPSR